MKQQTYRCAGCGRLIKCEANELSEFECPSCGSRECIIVSKTRLSEYRFIVPWEIQEETQHSSSRKILYSKSPASE